ncbi:2-hydroxychromene-2-carboxylate isomerase [Pseudomonas sp. HK3]
MTKTLDFYFDFVSPYSYLALAQLPKAIAGLDVQVNYKPVLLGALHQAQDMPSPAFIPNKAKWIHRDCHLWAEHYHLPLQWPKQFPFNTLFLLRTCLYLQQTQPQDMPIFIEKTFNAIWQEGLDVNSEQAVAEHLTNIGLDVNAILAGCQQSAVKEALKQTVADAHELGLFGVPAFKVGDDVFFGQDRLMFVKNALA